jgi:hypothetical protein
MAWSHGGLTGYMKRSGYGLQKIRHWAGAIVTLVTRARVNGHLLAQ